MGGWSTSTVDIPTILLFKLTSILAAVDPLVGSSSNQQNRVNGIKIHSGGEAAQITIYNCEGQDLN